MPVDAKNMEAWLDNKKPDQGRPSEEEPPPVEEDSRDEEEVTLDDEYPKLLPLLIEHGEMVEEVTDVLDPDLLEDEEAEFPEEELALLEDAVMTLPEELQEALAEEAMDIPWEAAIAVAERLVEEEAITSPERIAGLIFHSAKVMEPLGGDEEEEPPEEVAEEVEEV